VLEVCWRWRRKCGKSSQNYYSSDGGTRRAGTAAV